LPYSSRVAPTDSAASLAAVISTIGTCCSQEPPLPGLRPSLLNSLTRYSTVLRSPAVPGLRPSNSSLASATMCRS